MSDENGHWVTSNGGHILIKDENKTDSSDEKVKESILNGDVPSGWYVHGRNGSGDLQHGGHVIEMTRDAGTAEMYAGEKGSVWAIKEPSKVFDATDKGNTDKLFDKMNRDTNKDVAPAAIAECMIRIQESSGDNIERAKELFHEEINPTNIVDSAGFWDINDGEALSYFYSKTKCDFVKIRNGGAVALSKDSIKSFKVR